VVTINPRHRTFFTKVLGFRPIGEPRAYPNCQDAPAEALWVTPAMMQENAPRMYEESFGQPLPADALIAPKMSPDLIRQFDALSSQGDNNTIEDVLSYVAQYGSPRRW
jgi:hypothetical protein